MSPTIHRHGVLCTAYHEAGHAVAAVRLNIPFERVWILRREHDTQGQGQILGQVVRNLHLPRFKGISEEDAKHQVLQAMAGPMAENLLGLSPDLQANQDDVDTAFRILRFAFCAFVEQDGAAVFDQEDVRRNAAKLRSIFEQGLAAALPFVEQHRQAITKVADHLRTQWELSHAEVSALCTA